MMSPFAKQLYAAIGASCINLSNGFSIGLLSTIIPSIRAPGSPIQMTLDEESWLPGVLVLVMFPAQFICGMLTGRFGRKIFVILTLIPVLIAFLLFYFATSYAMLFAGSFLAGIMAGGMAICHMMLAEMLSPKYRGFILNAKTSMSVAGVALSHLLANYYDWRYVALYGAFIPLIGIFASFTIPESPAWLASKGRFKECKLAFIWFRGHNEEDELRQLIERQKKKLATRHMEKQTKKPSWTRFREFVSDRGFLKAIGISLTSVVLIEASGKQIFYMYAVDFIGKIIGTDKNPYFYAMILDAADIISVVISCIILPYVSRRRMLFITGVIGNIILFSFCLFMYLNSISIIPDNWSWLGLVIFGVYILLVGTGIIPVAFILIGEVVPLSHRGEGVAVNSVLFVVLMFLVAKLTPSMVLMLGIHGVFFINAIILTACLVYMYIFLPETDQKTLQNIEEEICGEALEEELQEFIRKDIERIVFKSKSVQNFEMQSMILSQ